MAVRVQIIFYSLHGHVYRVAEAVADGARQVTGVAVTLYQVPEFGADEKAAAGGHGQARAAFAHIPLARPDQLSEAEGVIFGTPTRFGNMCAQMRRFLDQTSTLWLRGALVGRVGSVFTSTASQHGGQETTITSFHNTLLHHGMIIVGVPYTEKRLLTMQEITGGSPYGAGTLAGADGSRQPTENELAIARFQGRHVADITRRLFG
jgi:NAD(P)H dehydrogenase (quinone)